MKTAVHFIPRAIARGSLTWLLFGLLGGAAPATAESVVFTTNTTIGDGVTTYEGYDVTVQGCTVTINGAHAFNSLTVERNVANQPGVVTHSPGFTNGVLNGLVLSIATNATVQGADGALAESRIDASADYSTGFANGPGRGADGVYVAAGAGHGGDGGNGDGGLLGGPGYGSVMNPTEPGSGGGNATVYGIAGGAGGGVLRLSVGGTLTINGRVAVDGGHGQSAYNQAVSGGGSGGSIWLAAGVLTGSGSLSANGGYGRGGWNGTSGGGAGGRIALHLGSDTFTGTKTARGNSGAICGGAGTIFTKHAGQAVGDLLIENGTYSGGLTRVLAAQQCDWITIAGQALVQMEGANLLFGNHLQVSGGARLALDGLAQFGDVLVLSDGFIEPLAGRNGFHLATTGDVTIELGGAISANEKGHPAATGPGRGTDAEFYAGGAGHGGAGGASSSGAAGGMTYGDFRHPLDLGSGGGNHASYFQLGGAGGGRLHLTVGGTLTVNGGLTANGGDGLRAYDFTASGGGSGGCIELAVGALAGTGSISASGGYAPLQAGGGGGGRIAIYTCNWQMSPAQIVANGGAGYLTGAAGTVLLGSPFLVITQQPIGGTVFAGEPATLTVAASTSHGTLAYQWRKDGVALTNDGHYSGVHSATLTISAALVSDQGDYDALMTDACGDGLSDTARLIVPPPGDMNCDGTVNFADINPFVLALTGQGPYQAAFPHCRWVLADCNQDASVNFADINPFVALLSGGD